MEAFMFRGDAISARILVLAAVVGLTASCTTSEAFPAASESDPGRDISLGKTFELLRTQRARVKSAQRDEHVDTGREVGVQELVGVERAVVQKELGPPDECDLLGNAPCPVAKAWYYDFYHLPEGSVGGGSTLSITFDDSGRCVRSAWMTFK
jgi:hypothetical protein